MMGNIGPLAIFEVKIRNIQNIFNMLMGKSRLKLTFLLNLWAVGKRMVPFSAATCLLVFMCTHRQEITSGVYCLQQNIPTQDSKSTRTFLHVLILFQFMATVKKSDRVDFLEEDCSTSTNTPYSVPRFKQTLTTPITPIRV